MIECAEVLTTLFEPERKEWGERLTMVDPEAFSRGRFLLQLYQAAGRSRAMILNGSIAGYRDVLAAMLIARRSRRPILILTDCTWKVGDSRIDRFLRRLGIRLIDRPEVYYCVLSSHEAERFPRTWGVAPRKVFFTPWYHGLSEADLEAPTSEDGAIFAGGDSLRDYGPLLEAARGLPVEVIIGSRFFRSESAPPNVTIGPVSPQRYVELARRASAVVVPLEAREDRSAGQCTYLNAMAFGKVAIVTDVLGVRDYIEHRKTGWIVPPHDPEALREALRWVSDPNNREEVKRIGARAREVARNRFGPDNYSARLLDVLDTILRSSSV
ncbi:MAG: glycosyltransferase [Bacteroidota bacterium]